MKLSTVLSTVIFSAALAMAACAPATEPEPETAPEPEVDLEAEAAAIRSIAEQVYETVNNREWDAHVALYAEEYEVWEESRDRATHKSRHEEAFEGQDDARYEIEEEIGLVFLTSDVAIRKTRTVASGLLDEDGKPLPPQRALAARVFVKKDGKWSVAATLTTPVAEQ